MSDEIVAPEKVLSEAISAMSFEGEIYDISRSTQVIARWATDRERERIVCKLRKDADKYDKGERGTSFIATGLRLEADEIESGKG